MSTEYIVDDGVPSRRGRPRTIRQGRHRLGRGSRWYMIKSTCDSLYHPTTVGGMARTAHPLLPRTDVLSPLLPLRLNHSNTTPPRSCPGKGNSPPHCSPSSHSRSFPPSDSYRPDSYRPDPRDRPYDHNSNAGGGGGGGGYRQEERYDDRRRSPPRDGGGRGGGDFKRGRYDVSPAPSGSAWSWD